MEVARDGNTWVGTSSGLIPDPSGLERTKRAFWKARVGTTRGLSGTLWVGTNQGLFRFANRGFSWQFHRTCNASNRGLDFFQGPTLNVWLCDREEGLFKW